MAFLTEKLIWAEQIYLDAVEHTSCSFYTKETWEMHERAMYEIINNIIQSFQCRSNSFELINNEQVEQWYNNIRKKLNLKPTKFNQGEIK